MKHIKITSVMLSAVMCASLVLMPVSAIADETEAPAETQTEETAPETTENDKESEAGETPDSQVKEEAKEAAPKIIDEGKCGGLTWVLAGTTLTISGNGYMNNYSYNGAPWNEYRDFITKVDIKSGALMIGSAAFYNCKKLTKVTIPSTVTSIGNFAFENCEKLTSVTIPSEVTYFGQSVFSGTGLKSVTLPAGIKKIEGHTFARCKALTSVVIPNGVERIEDYAFLGSGITSLKIPDSVEFIGEQVFSNCDKLTSITIPDSVKTLDNGAFEYCSSLRSVKLSKNMDTIWYGTFTGCSNLASITIPGSIKVISGIAFKDCPLLNDVYYDGSESDWNNIRIGDDNNGINVSAIHLGDGTVIPSKKSDNTLSVKPKTAKVKYKKLKKKNQTVSVFKVLTFTDGGQGKKTYSKVSGNKKITVNKTTGKVTVKKKLKKGTYKVKIKVMSTGNADYKPADQTVTIKIRVK